MLILGSSLRQTPPQRAQIIAQQHLTLKLVPCVRRHRRAQGDRPTLRSIRPKRCARLQGVVWSRLRACRAAPRCRPAEPGRNRSGAVGWVFGTSGVLGLDRVRSASLPGRRVAGRTACVPHKAIANRSRSGRSGAPSLAFTPRNCPFARPKRLEPLHVSNSGTMLCQSLSPRL